MRALLHRCWPLTTVLLFAFWLRTHDLIRRPMHADEANQAVKAGVLLESGRYAFDPRDHHGPTLYYAVLPVAWLRGETTLATLSETSVRFVPALAGTLGVWLLFLFAAPLGRWPATVAAAFLAVAPPTVYYDRYFIQETLLATCTLATFVCAQRWWRSGGVGWTLATGGCAGLMLATKASAPVFIGAALVAFSITRGRLPAPRHLLGNGLLAAVTALATAALFYSSFGAHPGGLRDALETYGWTWTRLHGATGHEKPWWYYLWLLTWQREGGLLFEQIPFIVVALAGAACALKVKLPLLRWAVFYSLLVLLLLSLPAYKTPWHIIHLVPGLALLAAGGLAVLPARPLANVATGALIALQGQQTWLTAFARPADPRNPYAYVHSSPDVLKFRPLVEAALARVPEQPVRIIGSEYWPLPWYLRGLPRIGYWNEPPAACDGALVITTTSQAGTVRACLRGRYTESFLGLRPGIICTVFTPAP